MRASGKLRQPNPRREECQSRSRSTTVGRSALGVGDRAVFAEALPLPIRDVIESRARPPRPASARRRPDAPAPAPRSGPIRSPAASRVRRTTRCGVTPFCTPIRPLPGPGQRVDPEREHRVHRRHERGRPGPQIHPDDAAGVVGHVQRTPVRRRAPSPWAGKQEGRLDEIARAYPRGAEPGRAPARDCRWRRLARRRRWLGRPRHGAAPSSRHLEAATAVPPCRGRRRSTALRPLSAGA